MNPVVHFEMPYDDRDHVSKFYDYVSFTDSEGNRVSLIQPLPMEQTPMGKKASVRSGTKKRSAPKKGAAANKSRSKSKHG